MPPLIQNIAISIYGFKRELKRYGGNFPNELKRIKNQEYANAEYIHNYQKEELRKLLFAADKSEHYHLIFDRMKINLTDNPYDILKKMPILSKQELRGNEQLFQTGRSKGDMVVHTSGSTGTPLTVRMNIEDFRLRMAMLERMKLRYGIDHRSRHISFVGKKITSNNSKSFWRYNRAGHQMVMSVYNLSEENANAYIKAIKAFQPEMIEGYPSAISIVAKWIIDRKDSIPLKCVLVTAETLSDEQKAVMEEAFCCPIVNYYGSTEGAPMITPCECGNLHVDYESGIIEFLDDNNLPVPEGHPAKMIVTCFTTKRTPLIRYDIGDMAIVGSNKCKCGRQTRTVKMIIGRCDDVFSTPEKGYVGRLSTTLKLLPSFVRKAQIRQIALTRFVLILESSQELSKEQKDVLIHDMLDKLGHVEVEIKYTDQIPTGANGKFRSQISLIGRDNI